MYRLWIKQAGRLASSVNTHGYDKACEIAVRAVEHRMVDEVQVRRVDDGRVVFTVTCGRRGLVRYE